MSDFNSNSPLFVELTPEQASIVEGGLTLTIHSVTCLKAGADGFFSGKDDVYITSGNSQIIGLPGSSVGSMDSGDKKKVNRTWVNSQSSLAIDLFDADGPFGNSDDYLGGFTAQSTGGQVFSKRVSGSGSRYRIFYSAV